MHPFYGRIRTVMKKEGSNRRKFCDKYGYKYQTLQSYWNTDKLPPGNVLADLSKEYNTSLDTLVFGKTLSLIGVQNPSLARITLLLKSLSEDDLLKVEGAVRMLQYISTTADGASPESLTKAVEEWASIEELEEE